MSGWLEKFPVADPTLDGIPIDIATFPTRYYEYKFALDSLAALPPGVVLDAGAGFNPQIHVLPQLLGNRGWHVIAVDANYASLQMPTHDRIIRWCYDICHLSRWQGTELDAWACISTLEHLENFESQLRTVQAGFGVLRSGGLALLTADLMAPSHLDAMLRYAGFDTEPCIPTCANHLTPRVSYAIGRKP